MKKIMVMIMAMVIMPAFATPICAVNDSVTVVLDPTVVPSGYTQDASTMTWRVTASYGAFSGISACINAGEGYSMGQNVANLEDTDNEGYTNPVRGNEKYGRCCWCKMTHPAVSRWVFHHAHSSVSNCASNCANRCGNDAQVNGALRISLFASITE